MEGAEKGTLEPHPERGNDCEFPLAGAVDGHINGSECINILRRVALHLQ